MLIVCIGCCLLHHGAILRLITVSCASSTPDLVDLLFESGVHLSVSVLKELRFVTLFFPVLTIHSIVAICIVSIIYIVWVLTVSAEILLTSTHVLFLNGNPLVLLIPSGLIWTALALTRIGVTIESDGSFAATTTEVTGVLTALEVLLLMLLLLLLLIV